jgi:hypothetical protein
LRRRLAAALVVLFSAAFARAGATPAARATPLVSEAPDTVLAKYAHALDVLPVPKFVEFDYSVEQVGMHDLVQTHRIYRSGGTERDEITSVDGQALPHSSIRIIRDRVDHYGIGAVAPREPRYTFSFIGKRRAGGHYDYLFSTHPRVQTAFFVRAIAIDGTHYLPSQVVFSATTRSARAEGRLLYGPIERYWMIDEAAVSARVAGKISRERITFGGYLFPPSLPESTFVQPRGAATPTP